MINNERMILNFIEMAQISSPSFNERNMADFVIAEFNKLGLNVVEDDAASKINGNTGNLIVNVEGTNNKTVLLSAHLDTVVPCDKINVIRQKGIIETDKTSVLGGDDKIGIAIILEICRIYETLENRPNLRIVISVAEEKGLTGASALDSKYLEGVDFAYVLDGGDDIGVVTTKAPYRIAGELIVTGKEAHAGLDPESGINALLVAAQALVKLKIGRIDAITTSNIGIVSGGLAQNIVMKEVSMRYETRSILKENILEQQKIVLECFEEVCKANNASFRHTLKQVTTGYSVSEDAKSISYIRASCEKLGIPFVMEASGGASDANIYSGKGVESLVLSVGMRNVHTVNEYVIESEFIQAANMLVTALQFVK